MKAQPRWMARMVAEAAQARTRMPWERGLRRAALIARRAQAAAPPLKRAS